jgi:hypothetical protein
MFCSSLKSKKSQSARATIIRFSMLKAREQSHLPKRALAGGFF